MHVLILAAGRGERMRPLTDSMPKPLLMAGGQRLIEYHLRALAAANMKHVVINHAYLGDQITTVLGSGKQYGVNIVYSPEPENALETAGGIVRALPLLRSDPFAVINGDIWTDFPFTGLPTRIPALGHLVLVDNPAHNHAGDFTLADNQVGVPVPGEGGDTLTFSGIGIYRRALFADLLPGRRPLAPVLRQAIANQQITGEHYRGSWTDVGTPERLRALDTALVNTAGD